MSDASIGAKPHYLVGDIGGTNARFAYVTPEQTQPQSLAKYRVADFQNFDEVMARLITCLLYTSPSPRDRTRSRMPSSA